MPTEKPNARIKKSITEIGHDVPANFKFGIIVAIALFWADFVRSLLSSIFSLINITAPVVANFILAIAVTILGYLVLISYRRMKSRLQKIKM
jgi:pilus assembly protein TadC